MKKFLLIFLELSKRQHHCILIDEEINHLPIRRTPGLSLNIPTPSNIQREQTTGQTPSTSSRTRNPPPELKSPNIPSQSRSMPRHLDLLHRELKNVRSDIQTMRQPGPETLKADLSNVQSIVESENRLKSGLNLRYFDNNGSFAKALSKAAPGARRERAVFRVDNRPGGPHHAVADIRQQPGKPLTLIVVEPATMGHLDHLFSHENLVQNIKDSSGLEDTRIAIIDAGAQKSPADCVIFSLSFASKMHKEEALFDDWHERLVKGEGINLQTSGDQRFAAGAPIIDGLQVLPASFFKHAHSMTQLFQGRPEIASAPLGSQPASGTAETLSERKERYSQKRFTRDGQKTYNTSIEFKRYNFLRHSIEALSNTGTHRDDVRKRK